MAAARVGNRRSNRCSRPVEDLGRSSIDPCRSRGAIYHYTLNVTTGMPLEQSKPLSIEAGKALMEKYDPVIQRYRSECDLQ